MKVIEGFPHMFFLCDIYVDIKKKTDKSFHEDAGHLF